MRTFVSLRKFSNIRRLQPPSYLSLYGFSLSNPDLVRNTWRHPSLPSVSRWIDDILQSGLISKDELLPEGIEGVAIISDDSSDSSVSLRPAV